MALSFSEAIPEDWFNWSEEEPVIINALDGGLTNQSFLLSANNNRYVLRINSPNSASLNLQRPAEELVLHAASEAGLCAPLVYCDPAYRYLVTRYLDGQIWSMSSPMALQQLAGLLRRIHQLPAIAVHLDIEQKIVCYWREIDAQVDQPSRARLQHLHKYVVEYINKVRALSDQACLCHNDLLVSNLIYLQNEVYAIDWEYAAIADPFYELAVIVEGNHLNQQQSAALLAAYLQREFVETDKKRLAYWRAIYSYLAALWYAVQLSGDSKLIEDEQREGLRSGLYVHIEKLESFLAGDDRLEI